LYVQIDSSVPVLVINFHPEISDYPVRTCQCLTVVAQFFVSCILFIAHRMAATALNSLLVKCENHIGQTVLPLNVILKPISSFLL